MNLDDLRIARPCNVAWDVMRQVVAGDDSRRFCVTCSQIVYNVADMTRPEAELLIQKSSGRVCVQMLRRKDGTVITRECTRRPSDDFQMPALRGGLT